MTQRHTHPFVPHEPLPRAPEPVLAQAAEQSPLPTAASTKTQIIDYMLQEGWHQEELDGKTKAELLDLLFPPPLPPIDVIL